MVKLEVGDIIRYKLLPSLRFEIVHDEGLMWGVCNIRGRARSRIKKANVDRFYEKIGEADC